jgi:2-C-methyl-D-erythritol 4-phosphate cytidylyltransferase
MATESDTLALVIAAAGEGVRLGHSAPKALVPIRGVPLVRRTLERFVGHSDLVEVLVAAPAAHVRDIEAALKGALRAPAVLRVVAGGATRQESVAIAVDAISVSTALVCVHDAARPLVSPTTIERVIAAAKRSGAATAASRPVDSVRQDVATGGSQALDRATLWMVETPQVFATTLLRDAHRLARARHFAATDDASLVERLAGAHVTVVASDGPNSKVTTRADLELVSSLLR